LAQRSRGAVCSGDLDRPVTDASHDINGATEGFDVPADGVDLGDLAVLNLRDPRLRDAHQGGNLNLGEPNVLPQLCELIAALLSAHSVSAVTVWEVAIKQATGKIEEPADLPERIRDCGFATLAISFEHAITAGRLPLIHRDPFDRMLVAQAKCKDLTLVTMDPHCQKYEVSVLPV